MKVTKNMVDKDLQGAFHFLKITPYLLSRKWGIHLLNFFLKFTKGKNSKGMDGKEYFIPNKSHEIRVRIFRPLNNNEKLPALFYFHGGGLAIGTPEMSLKFIEQLLQKRKCVVIAVDYRKSLKAPFPAAFDDCYDTILWAKRNAEELNIQENKFILAGHSAGGGLAVAMALKARDTKDFEIAFQMPIYPMLDNRLITVATRTIKVPVFDSRALTQCWDWYLRDLDQQKEIPIYAIPGRNYNYEDLPPTITLVGEFDPLRDQVQIFAERLKNQEIPVKFNLYKGCFHGFDDVVPNAQISKNALSFLLKSYANYYDQYVLQNMQFRNEVAS